MERVSALLSRKPKESAATDKKDKKPKKEKKKDKSATKKEKGKARAKVPTAPAVWDSWTVDPAIKEADFLAWKPTLEKIGLPATSAGEAWPTDVLRPISVDFGRSHFIFYGDADTTGHAELQRQQNLLYPNVMKTEAPPKAERIAYLTDLVGAAAAETWATECELTSPSRNRVVARIKYELLARWLAPKCPPLSAEEIRITALYLMYYATQGPLAHLKHIAQEHVPTELVAEYKEVIFACWRAYVVIEDGEPILQVRFRNYRPESGVWQLAYAIKDCGAHWELEFVIRVRRRAPVDAGRMTIRRKCEPVQGFAQEERSKYYGVWWPAMSNVVRYCDTCPTF